MAEGLVHTASFLTLPEWWWVNLCADKLSSCLAAQQPTLSVNWNCLRHKARHILMLLLCAIMFTLCTTAPQQFPMHEQSTHAFDNMIVLRLVQPCTQAVHRRTAWVQGQAWLEQYTGANQMLHPFMTKPESSTHFITKAKKSKLKFGSNN